MGERSVVGLARHRFKVRRIVNRYLIALEREERLRSTGSAGVVAASDVAIDSLALQPSFIDVAAEFGRRHGITHATWLEARVSVEVLEAAGVRVQCAAPDAVDANA